MNSSDVTYVPFRGTKNPDGGFTKLSVADPQLSRKRHREIVRFDEGLGPLVNGIVIAVTTAHEQGRTWSFSGAGEATLPDGKFDYEIALAPQAGSCELIESAGEETAAAPKKRIGFAWKGAQLHLFEVSGTVGKDLHCEATARRPHARRRREGSRSQMIVTVFRSRLKATAQPGYGTTAQRMSELARAMPGYVSHKSFVAEDGERVTIVEFADQASHDAWRRHAEHGAAQGHGRSISTANTRCRCAK